MNDITRTSNEQFFEWQRREAQDKFALVLVNPNGSEYVLALCDRIVEVRNSTHEPKPAASKELLTVDQATGMLLRCAGYVLPKEKADKLIEYIRALDRLAEPKPEASNARLAEFLRCKADGAGSEDAALFGLCARAIEESSGDEPETAHPFAWVCKYPLGKYEIIERTDRPNVPGEWFPVYSRPAPPPGADEPLRLLREAYFFVQDNFPENFPPDLLALSDVCATERYLKFWQDLSRYLASTVRYEPESPTATKGEDQ